MGTGYKSVIRQKRTYENERRGIASILAAIMSMLGASLTRRVFLILEFTLMGWFYQAGFSPWIASLQCR